MAIAVKPPTKYIVSCITNCAITSVLGVYDQIAEGDTSQVENILPPELAEVAFEVLLKEVRLPSPFHNTPPVSATRTHVERALQYQVNHVLIQLYRTDADYISEHSDKTVDVVRGSRVVSLSLGVRRTMTLRTKKDAAAVGAAATVTDGAARRTTQSVPLPHNSLFAMGLATNACGMHGDKSGRRRPRIRSRGARISLTFRHIGTFLTPSLRPSSSSSPAGTRAEARPVVHGGEEPKRLLGAFGAENHQSEFD
ncbi:hypothetical protein BC826DRAFT_1094354 [Russula brevipes]|nr:hypothetical protein BC826DRAFT_1094354 [Russula brevipes]